MKARSLNLEPDFPHAELVLSGPPFPRSSQAPAYLSQAPLNRPDVRIEPPTWNVHHSWAALRHLGLIPPLPALGLLGHGPLSRFSHAHAHALPAFYFIIYKSTGSLSHQKRASLIRWGTGWGPKWRLYATQTPPCRATEEPESPAVTAHRPIEVRGTGWRANLVPTDSPHRSTA